MLSQSSAAVLGMGDLFRYSVKEKLAWKKEKRNKSEILVWYVTNVVINTIGIKPSIKQIGQIMSQNGIYITTKAQNEFLSMKLLAALDFRVKLF